eukprot:COSAG01_NODE_3695_length_5785_cov_2.832601_6_plen_148_part_00
MARCRYLAASILLNGPQFVSRVSVRSGCALGQTGGAHSSKATLVEHGGAGHHGVGLMHSHVVPGGGASHAAAVTILSLRDLMSAPAWSGADLLLLKLDIEGGELQVCDPHGNVIEAPWLVNGGHGASLRCQNRWCVTRVCWWRWRWP